MQEHEAIRILLRQTLVGGAGEREVCDIPPIDVEDHERQVVGASLLRDCGAEEYSRTIERYEVVRSDWRGRLQTLRPLRVADPGGASGVRFSCCAGRFHGCLLLGHCSPSKIVWREANTLFGYGQPFALFPPAESNRRAVPRLADEKTSNFDAPAAASLPFDP